MLNILEIKEEFFTLYFITSNDGSENWTDGVREIMGEDGYIFQHRIVVTRSQAERITKRFAPSDIASRCAAPLLFQSDGSLPEQYAGIIVRPVAGKSVVKKLKQGFKFVCDDFRFVFGGPISSGPQISEQTLMLAFDSISDILGEAGLKEADLTRTWLYMDDLLKHYDLLNRAREKCFSKWFGATQDYLPASTGIQGRLHSHIPLTVDFCAFSGEKLEVNRVASLLQDEPTKYDKLFSRAVSVSFPQNVLLFISGTASIDKAGNSLLHGDFRGQVKKTLEVIEAILSGQGMDFESVRQVTVYIKKSEDFI